MPSSASIAPGILYLDARRGEYVCLESGTPEISWSVVSSDSSAKQAGYRILSKSQEGACLWDSGVVHSEQTSWIPWGGKPLPSGIVGTVQVALVNQNGQQSDFSAPQTFFTGYFCNQEWGAARWIWYDRNNYSTTAPSPYFRRRFHVRKGLKSARLSITARGIFEASLDGRKIGNGLLTPGWTDFRKQIPYLVYPLVLTEGEHVIGAVLADGWCCGNLTVFRYRNFYHPHPELLAKIDLTYEDGTQEEIVTDASWKCTTGPVLGADLYDGMDYDARLEMPGWNTINFDDAQWIAAADGGSVQETPALVARTAPPVRITQELRPVQILHPHKHTWIWDFGQNFVGSYRLRLKGIHGRKYTFQTAEMLEEDGSLYTLNYRGARSRDSYICSGPAEKWHEFSPSLTFHGFRYLQIDGFQLEKLEPSSLEVVGLVMGSDIPVTSAFRCGSPLVSRLWLNVLWGQRGNFLEIPTDCPQRDERLGWTGDAQVFASTALYNGDCRAFYRKYLRDVREAFREDGAAPSLAPAVIRLLDGAAAWGDAIILIPYQFYHHYGWEQILRENYNEMTRSLRWQKEHSDGYLFTTGQFGDWLAPEETPRSLVAAAYFIHCAACLAEIAEVLHHLEDCFEFQQMEQKARATFGRVYLDKNGLLIHQTQAALLFALAGHLVPEETRQEHIRLLEKKIRQNGTRLSTGFLATAILLPTLVETGLEKLACDLVLQEEYPSWLYSVKQGATTIWERWNSYSRDEGFGDPSMNSFNHYAYGSVGKFLLEEIGGIHYENDRVRFRIIPDSRFSPVQVHYDSPQGTIRSQWHYDEQGTLHWSVVVPTALQAVAELPNGSKRTLFSGEFVLV